LSTNFRARGQMLQRPYFFVADEL